MQTGQEKYGMQTMNQALARLVEQRADRARHGASAISSNRDELITILERGAGQPGAALAGQRPRPPMRQEVRK